MILLPANAGLAANAGTGPEGHRRTSSTDSGTSSDSTLVAADMDGIDGAIDGSHKPVAIGEALTSPPQRPSKRAAGVHDPEAHDAKRGRVSTDTASGAPALATTTNTAGSSTMAAPKVVSVYTATALAVADPYASALNEPDEAQNAGHDDAAPAHSAPVAARDAAAAASSAVPNGVIAPSTPAPASSAIVDHGGPTQPIASATAGATSALGAGASESATIDANPTSRGDAGCPETPVISRRSHVVAGAVSIRAFVIGRTSSPVPAPGAPLGALLALLASATALHGSGASLASPAPATEAKTPNTLDTGSKSAVIVANATSRVHPNCPRTPVVSRLPAPRSHVIPGAKVPAVPVNVGQYSAFRIGRRSSAPSTAPPAIAPATATGTAAADPPAPAPTPALPPMPATATSPRLQPQSSPARSGLLRTVSRVIQRGMGAIRDALIALYADGIGLTNGERSTSPGCPEEDGCGDGDAPIDAALLELRKRQHRRFL